jgi:putative oxidoreductase
MTLASNESSSFRRVVQAARRRHPMALRGLELVMGALFLYLGGAKLLGTPAAVRLFGDIGWGQWFRYVTGVVEVSGALLLLIPALAGASALLLMSVMVAATGIELFVLHHPPAAAMACLCAHSVIARGRRAQTRRLFARRRINPLACYRSNRRAPTSGPPAPGRT